MAGHEHVPLSERMTRQTQHSLCILIIGEEGGSAQFRCGAQTHSISRWDFQRRPYPGLAVLLLQTISVEADISQ